MRYRARINTGRINKKNGKEHTRSVSSPNNAASSYARSASVSSPSQPLFSFIRPHRTAQTIRVHTSPFSLLLLLNSAELLRHSHGPCRLPSLVPCRPSSLVPSNFHLRHSLSRASSSSLPLTLLSLFQTLASHGPSHNIHGPCHLSPHGPHHILNGPCHSRSRTDLKAQGSCHHPLGPCRHLEEHTMDRESRTKRNQDRAQAALRAQTPPPDHTPAPSSESSQYVQWSTPSSVHSATPQPAPSPARYDSEESDHYSGHYTDRAAVHEPNFFPMPTCRMFERF